MLVFAKILLFKFKEENEVPNKIKCARCDREFELQSGKDYLRLFLGKLTEEAKKYGWKNSHDGLICPDCVNSQISKIKRSFR